MLPAIDRLRDIEQECLDEYRILKERIRGCHTDRDFAIVEKLIWKFERRYRNVDAVEWTGRDLHGVFNNMKAARIRSGHY